jgi:hypothetical protein
VTRPQSFVGACRQTDHMNLQPVRTYYSESGSVLTEGLHEEYLPSSQFGFTFKVTCESVSPQSWRCEVSFGGKVLLTTEPFPTELRAGRAAEAEIANRRFHALML